MAPISLPLHSSPLFTHIWEFGRKCCDGKLNGIFLCLTFVNIKEWWDRRKTVFQYTELPFNSERIHHRRHNYFRPHFYAELSFNSERIHHRKHNYFRKLFLSGWCYKISKWWKWNARVGGSSHQYIQWHVNGGFRTPPIVNPPLQV